ncbi:MAG: GNAT family N-acetyltransferase [Pyrinomonadaceae bacterium]
MAAGPKLSKSELVIDWCPGSRISELQDFIQTHWRRDHILTRDEALLRWQYINHKDPDRLSILIAERDSALVGMLGVIPFGFCFTGRQASAAWLTTWVSSPESRGWQTGISLLQHALRQGHEVVGTLGMNQTTRRLLSALRFQIRDDIPRWVRIVSLEALEALLSGRPTPFSPECWSAWRGATQNGHTSSSKTGQSSTGVRIVDWSESMAERWNRSWREEFAPRQLGTWRDSQFLRWRYLEHPTFRYIVRFAENPADGDVLGLVVYRVETVRSTDIRVLRVVEFMSRKQAQQLLAAAVVEAGQEAGVAFVDFYCTSPVFVEPLRSVGFVQEDDFVEPLPNLFQPLEYERQRLNGALWAKPAAASDCVDVFMADDLYLTRADCDQDRPN